MTVFMIHLNPQQQKAVEHREGPLLILAGAGSGKTRVIVHRVARLINEDRVPARHILAVTFTNKAAEEMKERIKVLVSCSVSEMWVSTFHSACVRMLRANHERLGIIRDFVIYDADDQKALIKECLKELKLDNKNFNPTAIMTHIQGAKNYLKTPEDYAETIETYFEKQVADIYRVYQKKLRENQALDFGDLLMESVFLLQNNRTVLEYYQQFFQHILVDEYQDTNVAQYHWVRLLALKHRSLCVVGDDDQSIYRWRGADIENILRFEEDYPDSRVIKLEQNYRSTSVILDIASHVIKNNFGRKPKKLWTDNHGGDAAIWYLAADDREEARFVAQRIHQQKDQGRNYSDISVFYRTNAQTRMFEDELRRQKIPYVIYGSLSFYDRKEVKDILAYMRVLVNPADVIAFKRVFNTPARGLGAKAWEYVTKAAAFQGVTLIDLIKRCHELTEIPRAMRQKIASLGNLMGRFQLLHEEVTVGNLVEAILNESGLRKSLEMEQTVEAQDRLENLEEFLNVVAEYERGVEEPSLTGFLEQVALVEPTDAKARENRVRDLDFHEDSKGGSVSLMTFHLAKGLEFDVVFMVGMEERLFPHIRSLDKPEELEEERRLCYVGVTRARQKLFLTSSMNRRLYGGDQVNLPSRFLEEMPEELIVCEEQRQYTAPSIKLGIDYELDPIHDDFDFDQRPQDEVVASRVTMLKSAAGGRRLGHYPTRDPRSTCVDAKRAAQDERIQSLLRAGAHVKHPQFGSGMIRHCEGKGEDKKVVVSFESGQTKKLLVRYAHLRVVN